MKSQLSNDKIDQTDRAHNFVSQRLTNGRIIAPLFAVAVISLIGMLACEFVKQAINPEITLWQSQIITILFGSLLATITAYVVLRQRAALHRQVILELAERRRVEDALRESETRYRIISETASDMILTIDETQTILYVNQAAEKVFGYAVEELIGKNLSLLMPKRLIKNHHASVARYIATGKRPVSCQAVEVPGLHKDGREIPLEISFGEFTQDGKHIFTGVIRDITERKRAAEAIRKAKENHKLFQYANDSILIFEPKNEIILEVNDEACRTYGRTHAQLVGHSLKEFSQDVARGERQIEKLLKVGAYQSFETVHFHADGTPIYFLVNSSIIEYEGQQAVLSINRNVTARVQAEALLREIEKQRQVVIAGAPIILFALDANGVFTLSEGKALESLGSKPGEVVGKSAFDIYQNVPRVIEDVSRALSGESFTNIVSINNVYFETQYSPMYDADGQVTGVIGVSTDITARKLAEDQLLYNAFHDALTGLPNRARFSEHLEKAIDRARRRDDASFAVLFLDIDRFKIINDSLGHAEGDKLLVMFVRRLETLVRPGDIIARLGGDDFTILLDDLKDAQDALHIAERINEDLRSACFTIGGREVLISVSIGVALSQANDAKPNDVLRDADIAMYRAKALGKARYEVFNDSLHAQAKARLQAETELRHAIERQEFRVYYQPIVNLAHDSIAGFESLVRWQHPERGIIFPCEFIPLLEETGLIVPLGEWVLRESCRQLRMWQLGSSHNAELTVSVNLSPRQFAQPDLAELIARVLRETELEPRYLKLEITESCIMDDCQKVTFTLDSLRALGVELSIDDFGTGYSSLSYLHRFPLNYIKIDRSFVSRMATNKDNLEIVRTILMLAQNLKMRVIAEGIEDHAQAALLKQLECEFGQGYLFSKAVSADEIRHLIHDVENFSPVNAKSVNLELIG